MVCSKANTIIPKELRLFYTPLFIRQFVEEPYVYRGGHHSYHYGHHYRPPVYHSNYHGMSPGAEIATGVIGILDGVLRSRHYYH